MKKPALIAVLSAALGAAVAAGLSQPGTRYVDGPDGTKLPVLSSMVYTMMVDDLKIGTGEEVTRDSVVTVHYHGTLPDGTIFDSTRGKDPVKFELKKLIPGWQAGLRDMRAGGIRRLLLPPILAYGSKDRLGEDGKVKIPANSTLLFAIELVAVDNNPQTAAPAQEKGKPVTTASGLTIEDLVVGTGAECPKGATVKVHYRGTLTDGKEFDSSYARNEPIEFPLPNLIQGWQEGIPGMRIGGKRKLTVPYQLGYGEAGFPPDIPPKATLIFEIELLGVK
jgi:FKBP-type peptidyl-prolyl cis-trans isomerase